MNIIETAIFTAASFCSSFERRPFPFSGLKERRREKMIMTELAPTPNIMGGRMLKEWAIAKGANIPKKIAAL